MLKQVQHDIQLPVTLNCLGFASQKQVVRFTTLALTFVFVTSRLRSLRSHPPPLEKQFTGLFFSAECKSARFRV